MRALKLSELPELVRQQVEATEHNIEDLLMCLNGMRPDDVPSMRWDWEQEGWQPDLMDENGHYPQCFESQGDATCPAEANEKPLDYQIVWSVPICGRDQSQHWCDIQHFRTGSVRQAIVFDYDISTPRGSQQTIDEERLTIWLGTTEKRPLVKVYSSHDNRVEIDSDLLISLAKGFDDLRDYLKFERQAEEILRVRDQRHEETNLHTND